MNAAAPPGDRRSAAWAAACGAVWPLLFALGPLAALWRGGAAAPAAAPEAWHVLFGGLLTVAVALSTAALFPTAPGTLFARPRPARGGARLRFAAGLALGAAAALPALGLTALSLRLFARAGCAPAPQEALRRALDPATPAAVRAAVFAVAVLLAPLGEEIMHRATIFGGLVGAGAGVRSAAALSSLFFAALHLSMPHVPTLFFFALLLCALYRRGGLAASFGAHAAFNAANLALGFLVAPAAGAPG